MALNRSFITDLIAHAGSYGFQRNNKFIVFISGPSFENRQIGGINNPQLLSILNMQRLALTCVDASLPGRRLTTEDFRMYGNIRKIPTFDTYSNEISLSFLCSTDMFEFMYFKSWQDRVVKPQSHNPGFYNQYAKPFLITVMVLPNDVVSFSQIPNPYNYGNNAVNAYPYDDKSSGNQSIFFIKCIECYPVEISELPVSSSNSDISKITVKFAFRKWIDPIEQYYNQLIDNVNSDAANAVLNQDPSYVIKDDFTLPYADRGNVIAERNRELIEDRVGPQEQQIAPWQRFIKYTRDVIRYSNPNELKQLLVDGGIQVLGNEFGLENVESVAQAGQIIDVFRRSPDINLNTIQSRLLEPLSNIGNINPNGVGIGNLIGGINSNNIPGSNSSGNEINTSGFGFIRGNGIL